MSNELIKTIKQTRDYENLVEILGSPLGELLYEAVNTLEMQSEENIHIALAKAQFTGYYAAKLGESIVDLVNSMGLLIEEWKIIKKSFIRYVFTVDDAEEIDKYLKGKYERN